MPLGILPGVCRDKQLLELRRGDLSSVCVRRVMCELRCGTLLDLVVCVVQRVRLGLFRLGSRVFVVQGVIGGDFHL